jgi:glycosyltransferase involved in cell wall biosynthesis
VRKALFIANGILGDNPGVSGGETRFIEIAKRWAEEGYEIHLLSSQGGKKLCERMGLRVTLHCFSQSKASSRFALVFYALKAFFVLPRSLRDFEGIVYSANEMVFDVFPALRLKRKSPSRVIWATVVHWLPPFPPWKRSESKVLNATLFFINQRLSLMFANRYADWLLAVSPSTSRQLTKWGANQRKVHTVKCGVNFDEVRGHLADTQMVKEYDAVFMKRLQAVKGIFDLIRIWEIVAAKRPGSRLLIIGEGIDGAQARAIVRDKELTQAIDFAGVVYDQKEKYEKLASAKLFLLPTHEENWAIVIGEAMSVGIPVITYDLEELLEVWGNGIVATKKGDISEIAERVLGMLNSEAILSQQIERGYQSVRRYDWTQIALHELAVCQEFNSI